MGKTQGDTMRPRASAPATESRERSRVARRAGAAAVPVRDTDDGRVAPQAASSVPPMARGRGGESSLRVAPCLGRGEGGQKMDVGEGGSRNATAGRRRGAPTGGGGKKGCAAATADTAARLADRPRPTARGGW